MKIGRIKGSKGEIQQRLANSGHYIPMRYAPDILGGVMNSEYVDFVESASMACWMSPNILKAKLSMKV